MYREVISLNELIMMLFMLSCDFMLYREFMPCRWNSCQAMISRSHHVMVWFMLNNELSWKFMPKNEFIHGISLFSLSLFMGFPLIYDQCPNLWLLSQFAMLVRIYEKSRKTRKVTFRTAAMPRGQKLFCTFMKYRITSFWSRGL